MTRVLVMDGEQRASLAVVRSLGRAGFEPLVCSPRRHSLAGASRYAAESARVPDSLHDPEGFVSAVVDLVDRWGPAVVLPITEASVWAVLRGRDRFEGVKIPFPDMGAFDRANDKALVLREAAALNIAVPIQVTVATPGALAPGDALALRYPVAIKPTHSVARTSEGSIKMGPRYATSPATLLATLEGISGAAYPLLVQQRIVGPGQGVFLFRWQGRVLARFAHRRLREKPPAGGRSVYSESIEVSPELMAQAEALIARLDWEGVAMVEFKLDEATGIPYLMEVNPRFWGSLQLAIDAGVDFPTLLVRTALGQPVPLPTSYQVGVRCRWWWGNVDYALTRLRHADQALALPPDAPGRWQGIWEALSWRRGDRNEVFRADDPRPFVRESIDWLLRR